MFKVQSVLSAYRWQPKRPCGIPVFSIGSDKSLTLGWLTKANAQIKVSLCSNPILIRSLRKKSQGQVKNREKDNQEGRKIKIVISINVMLFSSTCPCNKLFLNTQRAHRAKSLLSSACTCTSTTYDKALHNHSLSHNKDIYLSCRKKTWTLRKQGKQVHVTLRSENSSTDQSLHTR